MIRIYEARMITYYILVLGKYHENHPNLGIDNDDFVIRMRNNLKMIRPNIEMLSYVLYNVYN